MADDGPDPRRDYPIVTTARFPHGVLCPDCGREVPDGYPFTSRPEAVTADGTLTTLVVCVYCG